MGNRLFPDPGFHLEVLKLLFQVFQLLRVRGVCKFGERASRDFAFVLDLGSFFAQSGLFCLQARDFLLVFIGLILRPFSAVDSFVQVHQRAVQLTTQIADLFFYRALLVLIGSDFSVRANQFLSGLFFFFKRLAKPRIQFLQVLFQLIARAHIRHLAGGLLLPEDKNPTAQQNLTIQGHDVIAFPYLFRQTENALQRINHKILAQQALYQS